MQNTAISFPSTLKRLLRIRRATLVFAAIFLSIILLAKCTNESSDAKTIDLKNKRFEEFAGSAACINCHMEIYNSHSATAHHQTSAPATEINILGTFERGKNAFAFDASTSVAMEKRNNKIYQVEYLNGVEKRADRFDVVVGSGKKGQSYLQWINRHMVQLPITFFSPAGQWSNSPGYPPHKVVYNRPITSRCLECHSTYFEKISEEENHPDEFDKNRIVYGVECEKCHGSAAAHVAFQTKNPEIKTAQFILNPSNFSRQQNLDLCGLCHGGRLNKTKPSFQFQAGDKLSHFFALNAEKADAASIDVHGNQLGLLSASKCYVLSQLTCNNCHNTHENEAGKVTIFSQRCMNCHSEAHGKICKMTAAIGPAITQNCIDCHMPKQYSKAVAVYLQGAEVPTPALLRTHFIKPYPEETSKVLALFNGQNRSLKTKPPINKN